MSFVVKVVCGKLA
ncbi:hypothetical protein K6U64_05915 [Vibrio vulnificus]|nr:hypothetical protein [Vibrio vulnificus]